MNTKTITTPGSLPEKYDLICFSHLRWDFVYQRPQHLLSRFGKQVRTFFMEEPVITEGPENLLEKSTPEGVFVLVPQLNPGLNEDETNERLRGMLNEFLASKQIEEYVLWYYTPMMLAFSDHLEPKLIVYDCMDELSAFKFAPPSLKRLEKELLAKADVVFTGGVSLYEHKKGDHHNIHAFPSSIEREHFGQARTIAEEPADQQQIPHPRIGFYGVVDERFDIELLDKTSAERPDWHFVLLGPVVKIDPATLPRRNNIHYLGSKSYRELPSYLAGWDIAMIPFARNESTRFISPTKTPEYLAAGKPVISTSIKDVVNPYQQNGLVEIADDAPAFISAAERIFSNPDSKGWLQQVDAFLANNSWDNTWSAMVKLMNASMKDTTTTNSTITNTKKTKEAYV
jgi:glycosyltransferase involved in cell wall biosynthesis